LTGLAVVAGLPLLQQVKFDFNPLNLRSSKVESVATMLELMKDPATSPDNIDILAPSLAEAMVLAHRLEQLPEVARATSLKSFIPQDQRKKLATIADAASLLTPVLEQIETTAQPTDAETVQALTQASDAFVDARGSGPSAALCLRLASVLIALATADPGRRASVQSALIAPFNRQLERIRSALKPEPISIGALPQDLVRDWIAADGRARVEVAPKGDVTDSKAMDRFVAAVLSVAPDATGNPVLIRKSADAVVRAFLEAGGLALVSITLILAIVLRRLSDVLVTLVPLLLAGVVTMEMTVLVGLPLNFANIIALPLLLGVGVAFKIYYIMAWREGQTRLLQSVLTRAVTFSACATATAFGSLYFSSDPGTSSMGKLLAISLLTTMTAAAFFQPMLMGKPREKEMHHHDRLKRVAAMSD
jgi:hopanoid biosynthesis associated RND transporter like protein HpnN